jgi:mannose-6-phosphate isomerase-like protein (cupin superfamily)
MNMRIEIDAGRELRWFGNTLVSVNLSSSAGADGIAVIEHWMPFGEAPPLHVHHREDEIFHILEGEMRFRVGDNDFVAAAGETLIARKGIPHAFRVESVAGARCLTITRGADFETMVKAASRPAATAGLPESATPTPEMIDMLVRICAENQIDIVGPPLG